MNTDAPPVLFRQLFSDHERLSRAVRLFGDGRYEALKWPYRPWRKLRPMARQAGIDPADAWTAIKLSRQGVWRPTEIAQTDGHPFGYAALPGLYERLHAIDHKLGGGGFADLSHEQGLLFDDDVKKRVVVRSLMDEAIDSSRIEGAVTTRQKALQLLRSGERPRTTSERMVVNNYRAMQWIKERSHERLTVEMLVQLQSILTEGTLDDVGAQGRLRIESDEVVVADRRSGEIVYTPPTAAALPERLERLCEFANQEHVGDLFIHPVLKACMLHFFVGYEHPFVDGNGRTARAVFYWSVLRSGYRAFEHLVISELILKAFAAYPQAFLDVEHDDGDLTYFLLFKLRVIDRSIERFVAHLGREREQIERSLGIVRRHRTLNLRQRLLLERALRHPADVYTVASHATSNDITPTTARADLEELRRKKLLSTFKVGKKVAYVPIPDLAKKLDIRQTGR